MKLIQSLCLTVMVGVFAIGASGQSTATLSGTVTDPSGAVVPNAKVVVHSLATGLDRVILTDGAGIYVAASLQQGDYKVTATASGFSMVTIKSDARCGHEDNGRHQAAARFSRGDGPGGEHCIADRDPDHHRRTGDRQTRCRSFRSTDATFSI